MRLFKLAPFLLQWDQHHHFLGHTQECTCRWTSGIGGARRPTGTLGIDDALDLVLCLYTCLDDDDVGDYDAIFIYLVL